MEIKVFSGLSIEDKAIREMHPISAVNYIIDIIEKCSDVLVHEIYTNNPDLVSAVKYLGEKHNITTEFFLDGVSHGNAIEPIFESFNKGFDLLDNLCK